MLSLLLDILPLPPPRAVDTVLAHAARAVHDAGSLRGKDLEVTASSAWVVATVTPAAHSGGATMAGQGTVIVKEGSWITVAAGAPTYGAQAHAYSWTEALRRGSQQMSAEDYYSPFASGGTILCHPATGASGIAQFGPVYLLFDDWKTYVPEAAAFTLRAPELFQETTGAAHVAPLLDLAAKSKGNKLLAVMALRVLTTAGRLPPDTTTEVVRKADNDVLAILTYVALEDLVRHPQSAVAREIENAVSAMQDRGKLRAVALGAFTAVLFHRGASVLARSQELRNRIREQLAAGSIVSDPYLAVMLQP